MQGDGTVEPRQARTAAVAGRRCRWRPARRSRAALGVALLALLVGACATSPLGRRQLRLMGDEQVAEMGATAFQEIKQESPPSRNAAVSDYVRCVAHAITARVRAPDGPTSWEVVVFEEEEPNAFALPGGKIGVNTGIVEVAKNQSQLATVIGHEVAHVIAHHANERVSTAMVAGTALQVVGQTGLNPNLLAALGLGAQVGVLLPFSRTQESEADIVGLDIMANAGFDPRESIDFWRNMEKAGGGRQVEFLSTHPSGQTRMKDLNGRMPHAVELYERAVADGRRPECR